MKRTGGKAFLLAAALSASLFIGCGTEKASVNADVFACQTDISNLSVPQNAQIVGLGEASHGVSEYHQMKEEVFQALVANHRSRTFIIEGDFGGCLKVDAYIHGGDGTAEEALGQIGFGIYKTAELAELIDWMRTYNETAEEGEDLHFYGMDMQRFDNNKEYLFEVLNQADFEHAGQYEDAFLNLTDEARPTLKQATLEQGMKDAQALLTEMDQSQEAIERVVGKDAFAFARECANSIYECCELTGSGADYNTLRDRHMAEKVDWFIGHGDGSVLFVNGHNGHIAKSASLYLSLGSILSETYGENYFAIGTDAAKTKFSSQGNSGFSVKKVKNGNELTAQLKNLDSNYYYLEFDRVEQDVDWQQILGSQQKITSLNVGIFGWQCMVSAFYTQNIIPRNAFDGMIVFGEVTPTHLSEQ